MQNGLKLTQSVLLEILIISPSIYGDELKQFEALIAVSSVPGERAAEAELHSGDRSTVEHLGQTVLMDNFGMRQ